MRERAALAGGALQVESTTSKGTTIYLTIPVTE
jgi:signal transduction histidine kinase